MRTREHVAVPRIAVVGAGGLGGPICLALAATGAALVIFDPDVVEASNLHRQIQFTLADVGRGKASTLAAAVVRRGGIATAVERRWTDERTDERADDEIDGDVDLIIDGSDDPATKFAVADWAARTGRPSVIAGAIGISGNVFVSAPGTACFRCLFEDPPEVAPSCAEAGVLGSVVAMVAGLAALAALELAAGRREHAGAIWVIEDGLAAPRPRRIAVARRAGCPSCAAAPIRDLGADASARERGAPWRSC
jgi:molybdopterin/thiamine biosynthesis adenylyltransferase